MDVVTVERHGWRRGRTGAREPWPLPAIETTSGNRRRSGVCQAAQGGGATGSGGGDSAVTSGTTSRSRDRKSTRSSIRGGGSDAPTAIHDDTTPWQASIARSVTCLLGTWRPGGGDSRGGLAEQQESAGMSHAPEGSVGRSVNIRVSSAASSSTSRPLRPTSSRRWPSSSISTTTTSPRPRSATSKPTASTPEQTTLWIASSTSSTGPSSPSSWG